MPSTQPIQREIANRQAASGAITGIGWRELPFVSHAEHDRRRDNVTEKIWREIFFEVAWGVERPTRVGIPFNALPIGETP